jgi:protocatechuate 3,4-dioxygenase beta subunit
VSLPILFAIEDWQCLILTLLVVGRLVDEIAHKHMTESTGDPTSSTILGPFWSPNAPFRDLGGSIIQDPHNGQVALMHGKVTDLVTKKGIPSAVVDIWQASSNGKYDFQDPENQTDNNLRGKFRTDENGEYWFHCLRPTAYSLPTDGKQFENPGVRGNERLTVTLFFFSGPAGTLLTLLDRHPMRPAHIHLMARLDP